jgi:endonuclease G, mitochondrial
MKNFYLLFVILLTDFCSYASEPVPYELPAPVERQEILEHGHFTVCYNIPYEQPAWVAYELTPEMLTGDITLRRPKFEKDTTLPVGGAEIKDYRKSNFLPGRLLHERFFNFDEDLLKKTYYMTVVSPMRSGFVNSFWPRVGSLLENWVEEYGSLYVACGPVLTDLPYTSLGASRIYIPRRFYLVVMNEERTNAVGFIFNNENTIASLNSFAKTVSEVEKETNLVFFNALKKEEAIGLKDQFNNNDWKW